MRSELNFILKIATAITFVLAGSSLSKAATITPKFDSSITNNHTGTNHAVFFKCELNARWETQSKGIVLKLPKHLTHKALDFAIVTGHGVKSGKKCFIEDFKGKSRKIMSVSFADNYEAGTDTDWALVSFKKFKGEHVKRYDINDYLEDITLLDDTTVSFAEARGLPSNTQKCRLDLIKFKSGTPSNNRYVSHDCHAIPGQSGSPITRMNNGGHSLIGIHLGSIWTLYSPITGKPGRLNFIKLYDQNMAAEIKNKIRQAQ